MSDLIDPIVILVDSSQTVTASKDLNGLGLAYAKMVQTVLYENKILSAAKKASASVVEEAEARTIQKQIAEEQKLTAAKAKEVAKQQVLAEKQIQDEENARFASIRKQISMMENSKRLDNSLQVKALKEETAERERVAAAEKREADQLEYLNMKYDKAYAAAKLYKSVQDEINLAMSKGVGNADQLQAQLNKLEMEYAAFGAGTTDIKNRFVQQAAAVEESRKGVNKWGLLVQQTGYQAGDFLVQLQSGTNVFVAFGQQATQLVGILPRFATELGISDVALGGITLGLSIAIPLLTAIGAYFSRTGESAKDASNGVVSYSDSIKNLSDELNSLKTRVSEAKFGVDTVAEADALQKIADLNFQIFKKKQEYRETDSLGTRQRLAEEILSMQDQASGLQVIVDQVEEQREALRKVNNQIVENTHQHQVYYESLKKAAADRAIAEQVSADKSTYLKNVFHAMAGEAGAVSTSLDGWAGKILNAADSMSILGQYMFKVNNLSGMKGRGLPAGGMPANFTQYSPTDYSGRAYGGAFAEDRMSGSSTPPTIKGTTTTGTGVGGAAKKDPLAELQKQIALQEELNGKTKAEQKVRQALGESWATYSPAVIKGLEDQIQKQMDLEERLKDQQAIWDTVKSSMSDAFMGMVDGTKSAKDAFKSMAAAIIKELYNVLVVQRMVGSFNASTGVGTGIQGFLGNLFTGGGAVSHAAIAGFANGGDIRAGVPIMVGERGPEMIIPKSSGTVLTNGQTKAALGSSESYVVHNNISVTGSDSAMVRQEIAKMIPQISSATKAAMIDAKRRGGQMSNAFR